MDLQPYYDLVEAAISKIIKVDAALCRSKDNKGEELPGQWNLVKGEHAVWIDIIYIEASQRAYFQVLAPMMDIPNTISPLFYREVLEHNSDLYGTAFVITHNKLCIKTMREADGLDLNECLESIHRVGNYASYFDPLLREKYFSSTPGYAPDSKLIND